MIQEIKIKNFLSFRDEVTLSFVASDDKFAEDCQVVTLHDEAATRLLRIGIVYGYNASGKSNLLKAFDFLHQFWKNDPSSADQGTRVQPFLFDGPSSAEPSRIELTFFVNVTKYTYLLELDPKQVRQEQLYYYKESRPVMLFQRTLKDGQSEVSFNQTEGDKVSEVVNEKITVECLRNMSFFVARDKANATLPLIDAAKSWMRTQFMPMIAPSTDLTGYAQVMTSHNQPLVGHLLDFLHEADFNITNMTTSDVLEQFSHGTVKRQRTTFQHTVENGAANASYDLQLGDESLGTLKTFGLETALYQVVQEQAFLSIDEVENSLHPKLLEKILFEYLKESSRSQILLTTHNDGLLDLVGDLLRKDSIWFTEKDKSGASDLYKLTDFRGLNRLSSVREAYRNKRFGATMNDVKSDITAFKSDVRAALCEYKEFQKGNHKLKTEEEFWKEFYKTS
jgi:hypothetical protein